MDGAAVWCASASRIRLGAKPDGRVWERLVSCERCEDFGGLKGENVARVLEETESRSEVRARDKMKVSVCGSRRGREVTGIV